MSSLEKYNEIMNDYDSVVRYVERAKMPKFFRFAKKSKNYPIKFLPFQYKSRRENKYYIEIEFKDKKAVKEQSYLITTLSTFTYRGANALISLTVDYFTNEPIVTIYLPHLFKRYRKRLFIKPEISNMDLIFQFFEDNPMGAYQPNPSEKYGPNAIACTVNRGLLLGIREENVFVYKTFLPDDSLNKKQQSKYNIVGLNNFMRNIA